MFSARAKLVADARRAGLRLAALAILLVSLGLTACSNSSLTASRAGAQDQSPNSNIQTGAQTPFDPSQYRGQSQAQTQGQVASPALYEDEVLAAQNNRAVKVEVTCTTRVKKLLPEDTRGRRHQKFLLGLSNGTTVLVAHSIDSAPYVPISPGDVITLHGEYIWNAKGGLIHWTHHSDSPRHEGGYIDFNGQRYQ
ncbi:MAG TPA: DUF3465 domain-containing protein [Candidatus Obscuribacter sp.]|nr:DUF3465 domain-containing protein [Candidatus Obscuribacter sp.]HMY02270.1 DUF3465 domain-containing protein [Candidatus Obscuribacter sp.]HND06057.1 DUF3465 domain-containing protein [Candidatus Obscuribacter sp.]HNG20524.1 DUF3465 domain-containing protein [Candidatus Obscuribacter sp.]